MKTSNFQTGDKGEELALKLLLDKGLELLHVNWRSSHQEVDLVMKQGKCLVIVEVKTRSSNDFGFPEKAVTKNKQKALVKAANAYLEEFKLDLDVRFDIVSLTRIQNNWEIHHIEDAFYPYDL